MQPHLQFLLFHTSLNIRLRVETHKLGNLLLIFIYTEISILFSNRKSKFC